MRELANLSHSGPKWIVLDGDIDPMWIESLNTVMDDNKVWPCAAEGRADSRVKLFPGLHSINTAYEIITRAVNR